MGDTESCSSRAVDLSSTQNRQHKQKVHIYNEVLHRLVDLNVADSTTPALEDELWAHFHRLPAGYSQTLAFTCIYIVYMYVYVYVIFIYYFTSLKLLCFW